MYNAHESNNTTSQDWESYSDNFADCEKRNAIAWAKPKKVINTTAIIITITFVSIIAFVVSYPNTTQFFSMLKGM